MDEREFHTYDPALYLDNDELIESYIVGAVRENDPAFLISALADIARARSLTELSKKTGMERKKLLEILYSASK